MTSALESMLIAIPHKHYTFKLGMRLHMYICIYTCLDKIDHPCCFQANGFFLTISQYCFQLCQLSIMFFILYICYHWYFFNVSQNVYTSLKHKEVKNNFSQINVLQKNLKVFMNDPKFPKLITVIFPTYITVIFDISVLNDSHKMSLCANAKIKKCKLRK